MFDGRIVKEGGPELVDQLEAEGYAGISEEVAASAPDVVTMAANTAARAARSSPRSRARASSTSTAPRRRRRRESVLDAMDDYYEHHRALGAPRRLPAGRRGDRAVRGRARRASRRGSNWPPRDTIFTRNATEAINLVAYALGPRERRRRATGSSSREMEHHSNFVPWQMLAQEVGASWSRCRLDDEGQLELDELDALLADGDVKLVAVAHVSNVRRHDQPGRRDRRAGARAPAPSSVHRRLAGRAADPGRPRRDRRRLLRLDRPQGLRADRRRRPARPPRPAAGHRAADRRRAHDLAGVRSRTSAGPRRRRSSRPARGDRRGHRPRRRGRLPRRRSAWTTSAPTSCEI